MLPVGREPAAVSRTSRVGHPRGELSVALTFDPVPSLRSPADVPTIPLPSWVAVLRAPDRHHRVCDLRGRPGSLGVELRKRSWMPAARQGWPGRASSSGACLSDSVVEERSFSAQSVTGVAVRPLASSNRSRQPGGTGSSREPNRGLVHPSGSPHRAAGRRSLAGPGRLLGVGAVSVGHLGGSSRRGERPVRGSRSTPCSGPGSKDSKVDPDRVFPRSWETPTSPGFNAREAGGVSRAPGDARASSAYRVCRSSPPVGHHHHRPPEPDPLRSRKQDPPGRGRPGGSRGDSRGAVVMAPRARCAASLSGATTSR